MPPYYYFMNEDGPENAALHDLISAIERSDMHHTSGKWGGHRHIPEPTTQAPLIWMEMNEVFVVPEE